MNLIERLNQILEVTKGIKNAYQKMPAKLKCPECGFKVPHYPGRYPKKCPECSAELKQVVQERRSNKGPTPNTLPPEDVLTKESLELIKRRRASIGPYTFKRAVTGSGDNKIIITDSDQAVPRIQKQLPERALVVVGFIEGQEGKGEVQAYITKNREFYLNSAIR